jgi:hypothetical protein
MSIVDNGPDVTAEAKPVLHGEHMAPINKMIGVDSYFAKLVSRVAPNVDKHDLNELLLWAYTQGREDLASEHIRRMVGGAK